MAINLNYVHCGCNSTTCFIGIRFDSNPNVLIFADKHGGDVVMQMNEKNTTELIDQLNELLKSIKHDNKKSTPGRKNTR